MHSFPVLTPRSRCFTLSQNNPGSPGAAQCRVLTYFRLLPRSPNVRHYAYHRAIAAVRHRNRNSHPRDEVPLPKSTLRNRGIPDFRRALRRPASPMLLWRRNEESSYRAAVRGGSQEGASRCIHPIASFPMTIPHFVPRLYSEPQASPGRRLTTNLTTGDPCAFRLL